MRDDGQEFVAGVVAMAVVDFLEAVEVQIDHRQMLAVPVGHRHCLLHAVGEQQAVRQAGQGVVVGDVLKLLLPCLHRRDVVEQRHVVLYRARVFLDRTDRQQCHIDLAAFVAVPGLAGPVAGVCGGLAQRLEECLGLASGMQ
ncbi:hypothetical protein D3C80_1567230 [compost metagenome]